MMNITKEISQLKNSILLEEEGDLTVFEDTLVKVEKAGWVNVKELCTVFDDNTVDHGVMFNIVHVIDRMYDENLVGTLRGVAEVTPSIMGKAREWVETLHYRILNTPELRKEYTILFENFDRETKEVIEGVLLDIREEDVENFGHKVNEVLGIN